MRAEAKLSGKWYAKLWCQMKSSRLRRRVLGSISVLLALLALTDVLCANYWFAVLSLLACLLAYKGYQSLRYDEFLWVTCLFHAERRLSDSRDHEIWHLEQIEQALYELTDRLK